ncbi:MAG: sigma-54-dependent transcriptional regulator [Bdellovibrionales bacterium]
MLNTKDKIMVIEDDVDAQELITEFFKTRGYEVVLYSDAEKALEDLQANRAQCGVIVTDLILPSISGIEFTKRIKALDIDTPIILMTAHKKIEIAVEAIKAGAYDFVVKPLNFTQLLISIERALHLVKVKRENTALKTAVQLQTGALSVDGFIGRSAGIRRALDLAKRVSRSTASVLVTGESGTGKEVIARTIHNMGPRRKEPFVAINCSAIPENLLESELFGHAKGSFTGASEKKIGLFEEAEGGTLFLDEIGDLSPSLQAKLLRVLQERKIKRIGETQFRNINVRIISATHKDLKKEIAAKSFREDLYFRLNVIPIHIPPLRERKEDIIPLAEFFLKKFCALNGVPVPKLDKEVLESLLSNPWRGNVRELENTIERAVVLSNGGPIELTDVAPEDFQTESLPDVEENFDIKKVAGSRILKIDELTKLYVQHVLDLNGGVKEKTAHDLGIDRKTLYRKIQEIDQARNGSSLVKN